MNSEKLTLIDPNGNPLAEVEVAQEENDWYMGKLLSEQFAPKLKEALEWYDEVVENQMLSYLDQATNAVEQFNLRIRYPDGDARKVFSFHLNQQNEVSFRTSPVPPPAWLTKSESA